MAIRLDLLELDKRGRTFAPSQLEEVKRTATRYSDLLVLAHGWNNNRKEAEQLFSAFLANVDALLAEGRVPALGGRSFAALGVLWPSKKFEDSELIPAGGAASTESGGDPIERLLMQLKSDSERLGEEQVDPARASVVVNLEKLLGALGGNPQARKEFVLNLRALMDISESHPEDGSEAFFQEEPEALFERLGLPVVAPLAAGSGDAVSIGSAASFGDVAMGAVAAARRMLNFLTYYQMKARAGVVGRQGLAVILREIRGTANPKLHLIGHSFGGRLVTAAVDALPDETPSITLSLLQAAFSHNGFAERFDGSRDGAFRGVLANRRASGPVVITHTKNDRAVGIAYPLASRIAHQQAAAWGDENDPYGGMGRNGAQHTPEMRSAGELQEVGGAYTFVPGSVFNLRADRFIADHGAVTGREVVYAVLSAAAVV